MIQRIFLSLLLVAGSAAAAAAQPGPDVLLKQAEALYEQLEYEKALRILIQIQAAPTATKIQKARAYLYMGVCFTALGKAQDAVTAFAEVLKRRPNFRMPPGVSPSIQAMFVQALKRLKLPLRPKPPGPKPPPRPSSGREVDIDARAPRKVTLGTPVEVKISVEDPDRRIAELLIYWRRRKGPDYSRIRLEYKPGSVTIKGTIPALGLGKKRGTLAYYVVARDARGRTLVSEGSEEEPREIALLAASKKKSKVGWWLLAIGGAVAVASGVVAAVVLTRESSGPPTPPPGSADLTVILR